MKFVFANMVHWRKLLAIFKHHFNIFHRSLQPYLDYDYDRCLDLILMGAGVRPLPGAEPWKRTCLILYRFLGFYHLIIAIAKVGFSAQNANDTFGICASIFFLVAHTAVCAKVYILGQYGEVIQQSRDFVNKHVACSRDPDYDATIRRTYARVPGKVTLAIFVALCFDQVVMSTPNTTRDRIFRLPEQFDVLGSLAVRVLMETYFAMLCVIWGCGYFIGPLTVIPLLHWLKQELLIVARSYEMVDQGNVTKASRKLFFFSVRLFGRLNRR